MAGWPSSFLRIDEYFQVIADDRDYDGIGNDEFVVIDAGDDGSVALRASNGKYLTVSDFGAVLVSFWPDSWLFWVLGARPPAPLKKKNAVVTPPTRRVRNALCRASRKKKCTASVAPTSREWHGGGTARLRIG